MYTTEVFNGDPFFSITPMEGIPFKTDFEIKVNKAIIENATKCEIGYFNALG